MWRALRELLPQHRFRRQHPIGPYSDRTLFRSDPIPIGPYIVDFACPRHKLAIELDGGQHALREQADAARTAELARHSYRVIRFWNNDVMNNLTGVLETIRRELDTRSR
ncbi:MAG: endonuclease domain-containing protein [Stellaceae bacterium]